VIATDKTLGLVQVRTHNGDWWVPKGNEWTLAFHLAEQDRQIYRAIEPGQIVLDCGANIGTFAKQAARQASRVIAIEPSAENLECLRRNLKAEIASGRVTVVGKGVWDRETVMKFFIDEQNTAANSFVIGSPDAKNTVELPLTTIDKLVAELELPRVDYIKMDIEGSERNALAGGRETIRRHKPGMSVCVYHRADDPVVVPRVVASIQPAYSSSVDCIPGAGHVQPQVVHFQ
jgi:FkbM family methyltransferase